MRIMKAMLALITMVTASGAAAERRDVLFPEVEYAVPVVAGLEPFAVFPLEDYSVRIRRGVHGKIEYNLPLELTGELMEIELEGSMVPVNGVIHMKGPLGTAECAGEECVIDYKNLNIDPVLVEKFLRGISQNEQEFASRMRVAGDFRLDPRGFIRPKKKTNPQN